MAPLYRSTIIFLGLLIIVACTPAETLPPQPTPARLIVSHSPSLRNLSSWLNYCAQTLPDLALFIDESPGFNLKMDQANLFLWLGEPPVVAGFSAPLGWDEIVIIVNPANPLQVLNSAAITSLYSGQISNWEQLGEEPLEINLWTFPQGNDIYKVFASVFLQGKPVTSFSHVAPTPTAMLQAVAEDEGAVGFLPKSWLSEGVTTIPVSYVKRDAMRLPLLALAKSEPSGIARNFLACLQSEKGQESIPEHYQPWNSSSLGEP